MKKQYEKLLWQIRDDMKKIPMSVSGLGSQSANLTSYIHTCRDLEKEHENVLCFLDYLQQVCFWENHIKKVHECDKEEVQYSIDYCKEEMMKNFNEFHSWVEERVSQNWN